MAEQVKKPGIFSRISRYFKDVRGEMKKVVWPSREKTLKDAGISLAFMAIIGVCVALLDTIMLFILQLIFGVGF